MACKCGGSCCSVKTSGKDVGDIYTEGLLIKLVEASDIAKTLSPLDYENLESDLMDDQQKDTEELKNDVGDEVDLSAIAGKI